MEKKRKSIDRASQKSDIEQGAPEGGAEVRFYQEGPGKVPFLRFADSLSPVDHGFIAAALEHLREFGHRLRPPHNEHLGDRLFYLRIRARHGNYRIFYWPHGREIMILGHGFSKKTSKCPPEEIEAARKARDRFLSDPILHTYREPGDDEQGNQRRH